MILPGVNLLGIGEKASQHWGSLRPHHLLTQVGHGLHISGGKEGERTATKSFLLSIILSVDCILKRNLQQGNSFLPVK